ncbi:uncharacterized protein LOC125522062 [Triticum urartu]|uniref:uncharacterized protein LOC125522062 n=1 Tax=Triticum urartu TaxID=4572 RepID=UPI00204482C3|nr:uncharacterized protein LOC125522062 [Triticum urartu]
MAPPQPHAALTVGGTTSRHARREAPQAAARPAGLGGKAHRAGQRWPEHGTPTPRPKHRRPRTATEHERRARRSGTPPLPHESPLVVEPLQRARAPPPPDPRGGFARRRLTGGGEEGAGRGRPLWWRDAPPSESPWGGQRGGLLPGKTFFLDLSVISTFLVHSYWGIQGTIVCRLHHYLHLGNG